MALLRAVRRWLVSPARGAPASLACYGDRKDAELRRDAESILRAAIESADPESAVASSLRDSPAALDNGGSVRIIALGKAASPMARGALAVLGDRIAGGVLVVPEGFPTAAPEPIRRMVGGHPFPDGRSVEAARAVLDVAASAGASDLLLVLLSGGGSSVAVMPPDGMEVRDVAAALSSLQEAGAPPEDLALLFRRLDALKGGGLAASAGAARVLSLAVSDVPGSRADRIASGTAVPDRARFADVQAALRKHGTWTTLPLAVRGHLERGLAGEIDETPKAGPPGFPKAEFRVVAGTETAAAAARDEAHRLGYETQILSTEMVGDAREAGRLLGEMARSLAAARQPGRPPQCVVSAGGTVVRGRADGRTGRNAELVLSAALELDGVEGAIFASLASDGADGATGAAGALATGGTARRALEVGLDPEPVLQAHDAYTLLQTLRDLLVTGPTGTDVGDVQVLLLA